MKLHIEIEIDLPDEVVGQATDSQVKQAVARELNLKHDLDLTNPMNPVFLNEFVSNHEITVTEA